MSVEFVQMPVKKTVELFLRKYDLEMISRRFNIFLKINETNPK
jgi:hypothetical protein